MEVAYSLDDILPRCDVLNLLRIQFERQSTRPFPSVREYALLYAMNASRMARAKKDILIMAPGPDQSRRGNHAGRGGRPALGDSQSGHQRTGGADGGPVAGHAEPATNALPQARPMRAAATASV